MKNDLCVRNHGVLRTILSKKMGESYFGDIVFEAFLWFCAVVLRRGFAPWFCAFFGVFRLLWSDKSSGFFVQ